jgi:hypothetical protein
MKSKRFKEEQIIRILQEAESGLAVVDVCHKHNCSEQSTSQRASSFRRAGFKAFFESPPAACADQD